MTSSDLQEMHHALWGGGRHSSLRYVFIKIRSQTCATTGKTTSIITLGTIVKIWTQGGGGGVFGNKGGGGAYSGMP